MILFLADGFGKSLVNSSELLVDDLEGGAGSDPESYSDSLESVGFSFPSSEGIEV